MSDTIVPMRLPPWSFRFLDLPKERRLRVLWFTDLVVPYDEVDGIEIHDCLVGEGFYFKTWAWDSGCRRDESGTNDEGYWRDSDDEDLYLSEFSYESERKRE